MEGTVIGQYRVLQKLGEGGMGAVYVGEHSLIGRKAAIKVLLPTLSAHQDVVQRFFNEARAATAISDPGIVQIFDFGYHTDGSAYIVMEYLEGETLDARLRRFGRLPAYDAVRILRQVASSLASAHSRGIIHRDLKPENIFLVKDNEVAGGERAKILDFGIAKLTGDQHSKVKTNTAAIMGTPWFMSPEQCRGAGTIDHRSDVYALGCVLFHLVTGSPPFDAEGAGEIIAAHLMSPPPPPSSRVPGIPEAIDRVVLRCLEKSPDARYGSMQELAQVLNQLAAQLTHPAVGQATVAISSHHPVPYVTPPPIGTYGTQPPAGYATAPPGAAYGTQPGGVPPASPTTLSHAASQIGLTATTPPRKRGLGIAIAAVAIAAAAGIGVVLATRGKTGGADTTTTPSKQPEPQPPTPTPAPPKPDVNPEPPKPDVNPEPPKPDVNPEPPKPEVEPQPPKPDVTTPDPEKTQPATKPDDKTEQEADRKKKRHHDRKKTTKPPSGGCNNGVPGDTDCDGIPDQR